MCDLLSDGEAPERLETPVRVEGRDRGALLADWLGEVPPAQLRAGGCRLARAGGA